MVNQPTPIAEGLYWVGALNPELRIFDVVMRTERGTSYNSYLLIDEKIVLFEAVKNHYEQQQLDRIRALIDPARIDYIVLEHTEPDHSGGIAALLEAAPNAQVLSSRAANGIVKEILGHEFPSRIVKQGDTLDTGKHEIRFIDAPFLHWPDSLFSYIPGPNALVSGDVFGFHRSDDRIFTDATDDVLPDQRYYFDAIFGPFTPYVQSALGKIRDLPIDLILPSHGTVYRTREDIQTVIARYDEWSRPAPARDGRTACFAYASSYGYTREVAEAIARALEGKGWHIALYDLATCDPAECRDAMAAADACFFGSSTLNHDILPPMWHLLTSLAFHELKGKRVATFGSYGWSGEGNKMMDDRLASMGAKLLAPSFKFRLHPSSNQEKRDALDAYVRTIADALA